MTVYEYKNIYTLSKHENYEKVIINYKNKFDIKYNICKNLHNLYTCKSLDIHYFCKVFFEYIDENNDDYTKNVINVFCTEYDIVRRVAKRILNYRLKEYEEDHDGAIRNGEGNQKLSADWDISFHDLGITADFLSKM